MDRAYLFSLPRDLLRGHPGVPEGRTSPGGTDKLNAAMSYGSRVPGRATRTPRAGFELLAKTVQQVTGIERFDAGAIINFTGFKKIVDAMGGVDMYIERDVQVRAPQAGRQARASGNPDGEGYVGPQAEYKKGNQHLNGWQALDYVRQRYPKNGVPDADYGRQRHQQQFVKAMVGQAFSADVVTNPIKLDRVLRAAGQSLIFNGRGNSVVDFALALQGHPLGHDRDDQAARRGHRHRHGVPGRAAPAGGAGLLHRPAQRAGRRLPAGAPRLQAEDSTERERAPAHVGAARRPWRSLATRVGWRRGVATRLSAIRRRSKETAWQSSFTSSS